MPPLPNVAGVIEIGLHWTIDEDTTSVTKLHYHTPGGTPSQADLTTLATAVKNAVSSNLTTYQGNHVNNTLVTCTDLGSTARTTGSVAGAGAGGTSTAFLPANCCLLSNYAIGRRYRGGKPRTYWPLGVQSDLADSQTWATARVTAYHGVLANLFAAILAATGGSITLDKQVSISYYSGGSWAIVSGRPKYTPVLRGTPLQDTILSFTISQKVASQRRRIGR